MVCIANQLACALSATAGFLSAVAPLLIKETVFLLSEYRQASERRVNMAVGGRETGLFYPPVTNTAVRQYSKLNRKGLLRRYHLITRLRAVGSSV